ncbi:phosphatase PAP2 family protein [Serratia nevei]|nr:phosphatase PAP2 family protein [Serratia marcescens]
MAILPPPPAENSAAFANDRAQYLQGHVLPDPGRRNLAASDAEYQNITLAFSRAFGHKISPDATPQLWSLLQGVLQDSHDFAMRSAKNHYQRLRPFVLYHDNTCTPKKDTKMAKTGSYPSGHASFGWATALVLAELNPTRQTEILRRGYDFGQSRVICGAHWQSDVDAGRLMGAAVYARLQSVPAYQQALAAARRELSGSQLSNAKSQ